MVCVFFSSRRRHTRYWRDWSSDVCSSDLNGEWKGGERLGFVHCSGPAKPSLVEQWGIHEVGIEVSHVAKHDPIAVIGYAIGHRVATPLGHGVPTVNATHMGAEALVGRYAVVKAYFLPSRELHAPLCYHVGHAAVEVLKEVVLAGVTLPAHEVEALGRPHPCALGYLVAAQMNVGEGQSGVGVHLPKLCYDLLHEAISGWQGHVDDIIGIGLGRNVVRRVGRFAQEILLGLGLVGSYILTVAGFHGHDGGPGVAGGLNLGYDLNVALGGVAEQVDESLATVEAVARCRGVGVMVAIVAREETVGLVVRVAPP